MNILQTMGSYYPIGGAQEVVKQISERLVRRGHEVTVATSWQVDRASKEINGVQIEEFKVSGNAIHGFQGEVDLYQKFLLEGDFDVMMNYAAQQWATDLVLPILKCCHTAKFLRRVGSLDYLSLNIPTTPEDAGFPKAV